MNEQIYRKLAERLDAFPIGFPATGSGVELRLLARIFTQEEAALAAVMDSTPEPCDEIAARAGVDPKVARYALEEMARKGLIGKREGEGRVTLFLWRRRFPSTSRSFPTSTLRGSWKRPGRGRCATASAASSSDSSAKGAITRSRCACCSRRLRGFSTTARSTAPYPGSRRWTSCARRRRQGWCTVPTTTAKGSTHLQLLHLRLHVPAGCGRVRPPHQRRSLGFSIGVDAGLCTGCGDCTERCQFGALSVPDEVCVVDRSRCVGCGLCTTACSTSALRLEQLPAGERTLPPADRREWTAQRSLGRG